MEMIMKEIVRTTGVLLAIAVLLGSLGLLVFDEERGSLASKARTEVSDSKDLRLALEKSRVMRK